MLILENAQKFSAEDPVLTENDPGYVRVWKNFEALCNIPRKSEHETLAIASIIKYAEERSLDYLNDDEGNVLVYLPATTPDMEEVPGIVFQGHVDMVSAGVPSPAELGVKPYRLIEKGTGKPWVQAYNTTLGADNGIGVSTMQALMDEKIPHGRIAFLFTNREETDMGSAKGLNLPETFAKYKFLVNFDWETEGQAAISSAGGADTITRFQSTLKSSAGKNIIDIRLSGLLGGHSGEEIALGNKNAAKVMGRILRELDTRIGGDWYNLVSIQGGEAHNAIMEDTIATIALNQNTEEVNTILQEILREILAEGVKRTERENIRLSATASEDQSGMMMDYPTGKNIVSFLNLVPDGVQKWHPTIKGLPQTSSNIGIISTDTQHTLEIHMLSRSSQDEELASLREEIASVAGAYGATVEQNEPYAGWPPVVESQINTLVAQTWEKMTGSNLEFYNTHAGLECGILRSKFPHLEAISIGPTIINAHKTTEAVDVRSVNRLYKFAKEFIDAVTQLDGQVNPV